MSHEYSVAWASFDHGPMDRRITESSGRKLDLAEASSIAQDLIRRGIRATVQSRDVTAWE